MTLLAASVVLALVTATEAFAPVPWFVGTLLVLLSRRWGAGDKALAVLAFGVLGVPLLLLGRDELPTAASLVVSVLLVAFWVAAAARLLVRARVAARAGASACGCAEPSGSAAGEGGPPVVGTALVWFSRVAGVVSLSLRTPCRPCRRHRAWPERPSPACRR